MPTKQEPQEPNEEYQAILSQLSDPEIISDWERFEVLKQKKDWLERIKEKQKDLQEIIKQIEENETIISAKEDPDLVVLADQELRVLKERERALKKELEELATKTSDDKKGTKASSVIVEIRAGVGGEEAALWAQDLLEMYSGFAKTQGWVQEVLDISQTSLRGIKEVIFGLRPVSGSLNPDILSQMKHEAGVHRVQRIPETEKSGRVHTSTATVAVLLKPKEIKDLKINPHDLKIDFFNATGPGGQNVNKRKTAVRICHLPTGQVVTSRTERSQLQNKENALAILAVKLLEKEAASRGKEVSGARRAQIGFAKRAEKIRTYNFPQSRVTDHRIKKSWKILEEILKGKLNPIIDDLEKYLSRPGQN